MSDSRSPECIVTQGSLTKIEKKPLVQRLAGNAAVKIGLGVLALGGAGYGIAKFEQAQNNRPIETPIGNQANFDPDQLDNRHQFVDNATAKNPTQEQTTSILQNPVSINFASTDPKDMPKVTVIQSFNLQQSGPVEVWRDTLTQFWSGKEVVVPANYQVKFTNPTDLGPTLFQGVGTNEVELFVHSPNETDGEVLSTRIYEKFTLEDGSYAICIISTDKSFIVSDRLKSHAIDPNHPQKGINFIQDILQTEGLKIKISEITAGREQGLIRTKFPSTTVNTYFSYPSSDKHKGMTAILSPQMSGQDILIIKPQ